MATVQKPILGALEELRILKKKYGEYIFNQALTQLRSERIERGRPNRKRPSKGTLAKLRERQGHICPICGDPLLVYGIQVDHINPNIMDEKRFNSIDNLQLVHTSCNLKKAAKTIGRQTKYLGKTVVEILKGGQA